MTIKPRAVIAPHTPSAMNAPTKAINMPTPITAQSLMSASLVASVLPEAEHALCKRASFWRQVDLRLPHVAEVPPRLHKLKARGLVAHTRAASDDRVSSAHPTAALLSFSSILSYLAQGRHGSLDQDQRLGGVHKGSGTHSSEDAPRGN